MSKPAKLTRCGTPEWRDFRAAAELLAWYERNRRDLPWRRTSDPYAILVSEIMLQQTRVGVVKPYFERFLALFPDLEALSEARIDDVLAVWSGLGYYRRAHQLHAAAKEISAGGGTMPESVEELQRLPGIGPYTAAAVASIAFGVAEPAIDGNVKRVISRLRGIRGPVDNGEGWRQVAGLARELLDRGRPGASNQAMMELGATLCRPSKPLCGECPLAVACVAAESGVPESYPGTTSRRSVDRVELEVALVQDGDRTLFFRRSTDAEIMPGFWELPWAKKQSHGSTISTLAGRYGGRWRMGPTIGTVRHAITHRDLRVTIRRASLEPATPLAENREAAWLAPAELAAKPTSSLVWKVLESAGASAD